MDKKCLKKGCEREIAFKCECGGDPIFMCKKHPSEHLSFGSNHQVVSLFIMPEDFESKLINDYLAITLTKIRKFKAETLKITQEIIDKTLESSRKLIENLESIESKFIQLFKSFKSLSEIYFEDFECFKKITEFKEDYVFNNLENVKNNLTLFL